MTSHPYADVLSGAGITFGSIFLSLGIALPFTALGLFVQTYDTELELSNRDSYANFLSFMAYYFVGAGGGIMLVSIISAIVVKTPKPLRKRTALKIGLITAAVVASILTVELVILPTVQSAVGYVAMPQQPEPEVIERIQVTNGTSSVNIQILSGESLGWTAIVVNAVTVGAAAFLGAIGSYYFNKKLENEKLKQKKEEEAAEARFARRMMMRELADFNRMFTHASSMMGTNGSFNVTQGSQDFEQIKRMLESSALYKEIPLPLKRRIFENLQDLELVDIAYLRLDRFQKDMLQSFQSTAGMLGLGTPGFLFDRRNLDETHKLTRTAESKLLELDSQEETKDK